MIELRPYQAASAEALFRALTAHRVGLDASDTGTGKTYVSAFLAEKIAAPVLVVCPKSVIPIWQRILALAGVTGFEVVNYEKLRAGRTPWGRWIAKAFEWIVPPNTLIVWDEAHYCKGKDSQNARMLKAAKPFRNIILSATLAETPIEMRAVGSLIGLHNWHDWYRWCLKTGCWKGPFGGLQFKKSTSEKHLLKLHNYMFPEYGSRVRIADLGDAFPECQITAEAYDLNDHGKIAAEYEAMEKEICKLIEDACANAGGINVLTVQMRTRQAVELIKVPGMVQMARELIEEGNSVVVFTNYVATLEAFCDALKTNCAIYGTSSSGHAQTAEERQGYIESFQADMDRVIVVNIAAGGQSISLHDLNGQHPRVSLICPTYNAKQLKQALGRIWRSGGLSKVIQRIIFAAGTIEELICKRVQEKLRNLDLLNDGDLELSPTISSYQKQIGKNGCVELAAAEVVLPDITSQSDFSAGSLTSIMPLTASTTPEISMSPELIHNTRKHARYSPSALKSLAICSGYINDESGDKKYADRGALGHQCIEKNTPNAILEDPALKQAVLWCIAYKTHILNKLSKSGDVQVHQEVELHYFDQWGFNDLVAVANKGTHAALIDWKFTNPLHHADSPQFWAYCLGIWNLWASVETIEVHVVHPFRGLIDVEGFSRTVHYDLFSARVAATIERGKRSTPDEYQAAAQCAYCARAGTCPVLAKIGIEIGLRYADSFVTLPPSGSLHGSEITDPGTMALLLKLAPVVEKAFKGWRKAGLDMWNQGVEIPGFELAHTAGRRNLDSARATYEVVKDRVPVDQFLDACSVSVPALEELYAATAKRGEKGKSKMQLMALLEDENLLSTGAGSAHLRPLRA